MAHDRYFRGYFEYMEHDGTRRDGQTVLVHDKSRARYELESNRRVTIACGGRWLSSEVRELAYSREGFLVKIA